jgi:hypothetical protein
MRSVFAVVALFVGIVFALLGLAGAAGLAPPATPPSATEGPRGSSAIPSGLEAVYRDAASRYCDGLEWEVLAGIGWIESHHAHGDADPTTGDVNPPITGPAIDGRAGFAAIADPTSPDGWAHARGPMQFLPSTWRRWAALAPGRPAGATPSPDNAWDAIHTAARMLCGGRARIGDLRRAVYGYNHDWAYVDAVFAKAADYASATGDPAR